MAENPRAWLTRSLTGLLRCDPHQVVDEATLEQLGADSLDVVEVAMAIEDNFCIKISDEEMATAKRVDQLLVLIEAKVAAR